MSTTSRFKNLSSVPYRVLAFMLCMMPALFSCSGSSGDTVTFVSGTLRFPQNGVVGTREVAIPNARITFDDYSPLLEDDEPQTPAVNFFLGTSDANGNFAISIEDTKVVLISAQGTLANNTIRVQSFVITDGRIQENIVFDSITTLAARALLESGVAGEIEIEKIQQSTITLFEEHARAVSSEMVVDMFDRNSILEATTAIRASLFPQPELPDDDGLGLDQELEAGDEMGIDDEEMTDEMLLDDELLEDELIDEAMDDDSSDEDEMN